jgi:hypothetical protein
MILTRVLESDRRSPRDDEHRALAFAEVEYQRLGSPREPTALAAAIETILTRSVADGIGYPRILLKRKKELGRRVWKPRETATVPTTVPHGGESPTPASQTSDTRATSDPAMEERARQLREQFERHLHEHPELRG